MWGRDTVEYYQTLGWVYIGHGDHGIFPTLGWVYMGQEDSGIFPDTCLGLHAAGRQWDISQHLAGGTCGWETVGYFTTLG